MQFDNYTSQQQLADIMQRGVRRTMLQKQIRPEQQPRKWAKAAAPEPFRTMGNRLGMDGNELMILINDGMESDSLVVQQALIKFLSLVKLTSTSSALADYHRQVQQDRQQFELRQRADAQHWNSQHKPANDRLNTQIREVEGQIRRRWLKQLDGLVLAVDRFNDHGVMCAVDLALWNQLHREGLGFLTVTAAGPLRRIRYSEASTLTIQRLTQILGEVNYQLSIPF